ncbi:hypothetical protein [Paraflavitalea pollutisoli]|uniref:hypothetical protein n=1 Tax=Paraflavitalea pollutisoli TaxID=3034143 RepID=UPI0023EBE110|nr:hypothetical protein [Paraflavitalea sp. H1-2-19X]
MKNVVLSMMTMIAVLFAHAQTADTGEVMLRDVVKATGGRFVPAAKTMKSKREWLMRYHRALDSVCLQLASIDEVGEPVEEYTVQHSTADDMPVKVWSMSTLPGHKYRVEVICNGVLDGGNASVEGKKKRGFLVDASWIINPGSTSITEATEYLGSGLSTADYLLTHVSSEIVLQAVGEARSLINFEFKVKVYTLYASL